MTSNNSQPNEKLFFGPYVFSVHLVKISRHERGFLTHKLYNMKTNNHLIIIVLLIKHSSIGSFDTGLVSAILKIGLSLPDRKMFQTLFEIRSIILQKYITI